MGKAQPNYLTEINTKTCHEHGVRASGLARRLSEQAPELCAMGRPTRTNVLKLAIERGLQSLEGEFGGPVGGVGSAGAF